MKKILKSLFVFLIFSLVLPISVFAEEVKKAEPVVTQAILLADVNIKEAKVIAQDGHNLKISFSVLNNEDAQGGLMYGIKTYALDKDGNISGAVDEKKYDEVFSLPANGVFNKEITYEAPLSLSGNFELFLFIKNKSDFLFSISSIAKINFQSSSGVEIINGSCKVLVNQKNENNYSVYQPFKINKGDALSVSCDVKNYEKSSLNLVPVVEMHYGSTFGETVSTPDFNSENVSIGGAEKKNFSIDLPVSNLKSQKYGAVLYFKSDKFVSNKINIDFVVDGEMVIINNLSIDKDYYKRGDVAKVYLVGSFYFSDSNDIENRSKEFTTTAKISSAFNGRNCGSSKDEIISMANREPKFEIPVRIKRECIDPKVMIIIKNSNGEVLEEQTFLFDSVNMPTKENNLKTIIITVLALIILGILIYIKNKKNINSSNASTTAMSIMFLLFTLSFFTPASNASAATFTIGMYNPVLSTVTVNFSGSKTSYRAGESITVTGQISYPWATGSGMPIYDFSVNGVRFSGAPALPTQVLNYPWTKTFNAPSTPGAYTVDYSVDMYCPPGARFDQFLGYCYDPKLSLRTYNSYGNTSTNIRTLDCDFSFSNWHPYDFLSIGSTYCGGASTNIYYSEGRAALGPDVDGTLNQLVSLFNNKVNGCTALQDKTKYPSAAHHDGTNTILLSSQYGDTLSCNFSNSNAPDHHIYNYSASYSVVEPSVDVKVDTVDGPINKNTGDSVAVSWKTTNVISPSTCSCQCQDGSGNPIDCGGSSTQNPKSYCGSGIGSDVKSTPQVITNILQPITFKVTCN